MIRSYVHVGIIERKKEREREREKAVYFAYIPRVNDHNLNVVHDHEMR